MEKSSSLAERQRRILQAIINTYITTAEAVGSRTVAKKMGSTLSPATVRNAMADLEEMGYVRQPHTSAGRVPTDLGYRFYVDTLMEVRAVDRQDQVRVEEQYRAEIKQIEDLMALSSKVLSFLTSYTAVVQEPKMDTETIRRLEVVPLSNNKVLAVLVTNVGDVRTSVSILPAGTPESILEQLTTFLNDNLFALSVTAISSLLDSVEPFGDSTDPLDERLAALAHQVFRGVLFEEPKRAVFLNGMEKIFDHPEFQSLDQLRPVLRVLDEKGQVNELLESCIVTDGPTGVCIRIGSENQLDDVRNCSIVVSPYQIAGKTMGAIGVIGPTRMQYSRTSSLVAFVAAKLGCVLTELSGGE